MAIAAAVKGASLLSKLRNLLVGAKAAGATTSRMAGGPAFTGGLGKAFFGDAKKGDIALRLLPDAGFGVLAGIQTPGAIGDKLIAGSTQAIGGGLGGVALARGAGVLGAGQRVQDLVDLAGSVGGDYGGMYAGDALQRGKDKLFGGEGLTAYERLSAEQQEEFAEQIRQQTLAGAGLLVPGIQQQYGMLQV